MSVTLSHQSALDVMRSLRCEGLTTSDMDIVSLVSPSAWVGQRLGMNNFSSDVWNWQQPTDNRPLHILVPSAKDRTRGKTVVAHVACGDLPADSVLWLDEHASIVCPELLFLQMAESFTLSALVMLGLELCGHFSRHPYAPLASDVVDGIPAATSVKRLKAYLSSFKWVRGLDNARVALQYVCDHAVSAPEAVLATMYGLPPAEGGYGMGPVRLNERVELENSGALGKAKARYPDLTFDFAALGLNYDGAKHFDIVDLMEAAEAFARSEGAERDTARSALREKLILTRAKVLDDNLRDRQLAAQGRIVFPVTKEDLADITHLDELTRQMLGCAQKVFGADVERYRETLESTAFVRERGDLLRQLTSHGGAGGLSYGRM